ncbi:MAG: bifunctional 2-polyprenyl-6-hydroxyphenol methylase/3-demethylubiquinol 3-O-methyltransferase UbiG [Gammaproteobacteria bacterium]|nr:bifunctional 2-polyprenyl-6-hydroxyphenol methylase/3-demethylubiquinol 3-O-methyltransferase UbiG [Gammaproteobacteria bacterium]MCI0590026.1 bifunctional 2-polyprenyl-6-hydroxyphenol methylase/3-demethylubiquinol 3-O-methyltransferase UbiG [Gammaproteobacteria bacterium]
MRYATDNVDNQELAKFEAASGQWWDRTGEFRTLHEINPLRLNYVDQRVGLAGKRIVDVGCGGGILAEGMAIRGAIVTGIDVSAAALAAAREHQSSAGVAAEYVQTTPEQFAETHQGQFDVVTCMELLEHVPDPASVVQACARLLTMGGHAFFSTINRTLKAYLLAIIGAEYVLGVLAKGTHNYARFIRPSELASWSREVALELRDITGLSYNPLMRRYFLGRDVDVNYILHAELHDDTGP